MIGAGIDAGSRSVKVVILDGASGTILAKGIADQGVRQKELAAELFESALAQSGLERAALHRVVATGYARNIVPCADSTITEISCHARGVHHLVPEARTIIEIGGQDSKMLWLEADGRVRHFTMNDRCAAGTGRFLEVVAARLDIPVASLGDCALRCVDPAAISSMCVVFAETEIIGLLASGAAIEDIIAGVQNSIAARIASMAGRRAVSPVFFTGGVALVSGMSEALGRALGQPVQTVPDPQMTGALGAALFACEE
ncbi:MAG: acyl-CoA dehydratase activase [Planctomycetota bacterium]